MRKLVLVFVAGLFISAGAWAQDFDKGSEAAQRGDWATAFQEWLPLAKEGDIEAQFLVGKMYRDGTGTLQNYREAVKWLTLSAEKGNAEAQYNLATMYIDGHGVERNLTTSAKWLKLSAEQRHAEAQYILGALYEKGVGGYKSDVFAHMWYNLSAANGYDNSAKTRDNIAKEMTPQRIERAQDLAQRCVAKNYKGCYDFWELMKQEKK